MKEHKKVETESLWHLIPRVCVTAFCGNIYQRDEQICALFCHHPLGNLFINLRASERFRRSEGNIWRDFLRCTAKLFYHTKNCTLLCIWCLEYWRYTHYRQFVHSVTVWPHTDIFFLLEQKTFYFYWRCVRIANKIDLIVMYKSKLKGFKTRQVSKVLMKKQSQKNEK